MTGEEHEPLGVVGRNEAMDFKAREGEETRQSRDEDAGRYPVRMEISDGAARARVRAEPTPWKSMR